MIQVQEQLSAKGFTLNGKAIDVITYLEREAERCPKMGILQYVKQRKLENGISKQIGVSDIRTGYENVLR